MIVSEAARRIAALETGSALVGDDLKAPPVVMTWTP